MEIVITPNNKITVILKTSHSQDWNMNLTHNHKHGKNKQYIDITKYKIHFLWNYVCHSAGIIIRLKYEYHN